MTNMKKYLMIVAFSVFIGLAGIVLATLNLEFTISLQKNYFYPNETIPITINIISREVTYSAKNLSLAIIVGQRIFYFELGDLPASQIMTKNITLSELPSGTYIIRGILNYTGYFGERNTLETYNSFDVKFPEIKLLPRNVFIKSFDIPNNVTQDKPYQAIITVINNGTIPADLVASVNSVDSNVSKTFHLEPGETQSLFLDVTSTNAGLTLIEARVYAQVDNTKYLMNYVVKNVFVQEYKVAKIQFEKMELVDEQDGQINQNDEVKLKIYLKNVGDSAASDVKGNLSSQDIQVIKQTVDYKLLLAKETIAQDYFSIKTINVRVGQYNLTLDVTFNDLSGSHKVRLSVSIEVKEDIPQTCQSDSDCSGNEICKNNKCEKLTCECGEPKNHICVKYECCSNYDCDEGYACTEKHICKPSAVIKADVLIVTTTKLKMSDEFKNTLKIYRGTISSEGLSSFFVVLDSPKTESLFNVKVQNIADWKSVKEALDKIASKLDSKYILILGGVDVIPMPPAKTDAEIPTQPVSDDRYSDITLDGLPDVALGRIPTPNGDNSDKIVITALKSAINMHKKAQLNKVVLADTCIFPPNCEFGLHDVNLLSQRFFSKDCYNTDRCKPAPPYCTGYNCNNKNEFYQELTTNDIIHLDAHGEPYSFAAHNKDGWFTVFVSADLYKNQFKVNPIFTTAACHSATIDCEEFGCINSKGSPFAFLANGASVYIGNTRYGYGGITARLLDEFYSNAKSSTIGESLMKMKRSNLANIVTSDWERAVIYEIQLYGDPTIKINRWMMWT